MAYSKVEEYPAVGTYEEDHIAKRDRLDTLLNITPPGVRRFAWAHYRQRAAGIGFEIINEGSTDAFSDQEAKLHATRSAGVGDWNKAWRDATGEFIRADGRSDGFIKFNGNKRLRGLKSNGLGYTEYVVLYLE